MPVGSQPPILANDFARQWEQIRVDAIDAVERVGRSGWLVLGEEVRTFEREFAAWWGVPHAVGVASGLDALEIALRCLDLRTGSRVLTTPLTAFATTLAIIRAGAEPVWCDVDESGGLDLAQADAALRADPSIRAVMPVHLYGHPLDLLGLEDLAADHEIVVIEDCAQSTGARRNDKPTGVAGIVAGTSLYPTKNLGAMGDGGVLLTSDPDLAERAKTFRDYGQASRYEHVELGLNSRLDELQAAILRTALLPRLDRWLARRREIAQIYEDALRDSALRPIVASEGESAHHLFPVELERGDAADFGKHLASHGVGVGRHYPVPCPDQPAARGRGIVLGSIPVARRIAKRELSLPIHPHLEDREVEFVVQACLDGCP
ncbi:MAG TPA: DegT/DnrJ/EryC1/StrS family aminotransferase [Solirubrobacteraceae bacterium]|jgi:dTDP-3-amino-3,4,6-trideoxy-alpha-D-glucose transaminase|nr:DegT/DnrJ/EryC1/StrS family aminotransferase [Solirubrobacteraceae bacterium]